MIALPEVLNSILSAASSRLIEEGVTAKLVHLAPGAQIAWDDCCEASGQLSLRVLDIHSTAGQNAPFPQPDTQVMRKDGGCKIHTLAVQLGLCIVRCVHVLDDNGRSPSGSQMTGDATRMLDDMHLLLDVLACEVPGLPGVRAIRIGRWLPQGPDGGCAGGEWQFHIAFDPCLCRSSDD